MADILLTHGYFLQEDEKEQQIMRPYPPLGLLCLSAYLQRAGFSVDVHDTTLSTRADLAGRLQRGTGTLGIYTNLMTRRSVLDIVAHARRHGWTVVLGGPESANYPEEYLAHGAHVVVFGEGEEALAELLPALRDRGPHALHAVPGIAFLDEHGRVVRAADRAQIADIDALPWPDRSRVDVNAYLDLWRSRHGMGSVNLITARGCPYRCTWCSHAVFGYSHRRRSPADCAEELLHIRDTWQPEMVWYADDVFTINHPWLFRYREELRARGLRVPFETITRADRMLKEEVLETLAEMGCFRIWIGSESGSRRVLEAMQRGVTPEQVQWACHAARRHGIQVGMFLMWGYEGEALGDIEATIDHVKRAAPDIFLTTVAYPIKNTAYFERVADRVEAARPWAESTDRDYVIRGRPSRDYYRHADQWLRNAVAAHQLEESDPQAAARHRADARQAREALVASAGEVAA